MKIDTEMRFPHPVLWAETTDYSNSAFEVALDVSENASTGSVQLKCQVTLTESGMHALCAAGDAALGLSIVCLNTYFNKLHELPLNGGQVSIGAGQLRGQVMVRPLIWARLPITGFSSPNIHSEFGPGPFSFHKCAILALGNESVIDVGTEKLAPIGSVFTLARDDDVPQNQFAVQTEEDKVQILAHNSTLGWISQMRNTPEGKAILLNSIYLPVVMTVLDTIQDKDALHEDKRWHRIFTAKLTALGFTIDTADDLLKTAQALLKSPLALLEQKQ